jgi:predicted TIM-barrel fold metal-dependent hydrolase
VLAGSNIKGDYPMAQIMGQDRFNRMNARGIDMQVISINQYWWYPAERDLAAKIVRVHDEGIAEWCKANSERFVGLTSPALQHPDLAAEQLDYAVKRLGLKGASIGGNVKGEARRARNTIRSGARPKSCRCRYSCTRPTPIISCRTRFSKAAATSAISSAIPSRRRCS